MGYSSSSFVFRWRPRNIGSKPTHPSGDTARPRAPPGNRFFADDGATVLSDRVEYQLPGGAVGRAVSPLGWVGFEPMFRGRHGKTKELLE